MVGLVTAVSSLLVVMFNYEVLALLHRWYLRDGQNDVAVRSPRQTIVVVILVLLVAHLLEIVFFGLLFWWMQAVDGLGELVGYEHFGLLDCIYFSAASYSTVGWGEIVAVGAMRITAGIESLLGFLMITWTASFSYLVMGQAWGKGD